MTLTNPQINENTIEDHGIIIIAKTHDNKNAIYYKGYWYFEQGRI
jgi:hypothetical protein